VGTVTELHDYLRLLFAKIARPRCPKCGKDLKAWTPSSVVQELLEKHTGERALLIFDTDEKPEELQKRGFHRVRERGTDVPSLLDREGRQQDVQHEVILDRLMIRDEPRLSDSVETAWEQGKQGIKVEIVNQLTDKNRILLFPSELRCLECDTGIAKPQPLLFSFNHPLGACPVCKGFGNTLEYSEDSIVPDRELSIADGAIEPWSKPAYRRWYRQFAKAAKKKGIKLKVPYKSLSGKIRELIFRGDADFYGLNEFFEKLERKRYKLHVRVFLSRYRSPVVCRSCNGSRLRPEALAFTIGGYNIARVTGLSIARLHDYLSTLRLTDYEQELSREIQRQIKVKIAFLFRVGLGYLTLDRQAKTLSGGESQRINLANQLASKLTGTLYVLDEPTIGLHPRDVGKVIEIIRELADIGNTIITVEHDRSVIESADWIVELGPGGGRDGGNLVFSGEKRDFLKTRTLTSKYLAGRESIQIPGRRRRGSGKVLSIQGASGNNLKAIDINIPLQTLVCITGVSGSGKSTLIRDTVYRAVARAFKIDFESPLQFESLSGLEYLKGVSMIDQHPIGKTPRSNPVTYIKALDHIRKLFADQFSAKNLGYGPGHFSFNTEDGRCEVCRGDGLQKLEMYFFEDLYIKCEECSGKRYKRGVLTVTYKGKNMHDVLELTIDEALQFFSDLPSFKKRLELMSSVGLGYLKLGQPATTLSGGEAQRLKICAELGIAQRNNYLYILDEPTVGLHPHDIKKLINVLDNLVDAGNTVLLVEHNLDVIKCADRVIDLGPEGGENGGYIMTQGTPEQVARKKKSYTGQYLREYLKHR
jgi:excinuclease ABC subunit A